MNIDKRLEELAGNPNPLKDDIAGLAAALLGARQALEDICKRHCGPDWRDNPDMAQHAEALDDTAELEELLR